MVESDRQLQSPSADAGVQPGRPGLAVPFITTRPLTDVALLFVLVPLWWLIGLDQLIWAPALLGIALKVVREQGWRLSYPPVLKWLGLFIVAQLISALFIDEGFRYLTFARTLGAYVTATLLVFVLVNSLDEWRDIDLLLTSIVAFMGVAAVVGYMGFTMLWRPSYTTLLGVLLGDLFSESMYITRLLHNDIGAYTRLLGMAYFRTRSIFMFNTMYAPALCITVPLLLFFLRRERIRTRRILLWIVLGLVALNQLASGGRVALISGLAGGLVFAQPWALVARLPHALKLAGAAVVLLGLALLLTPPARGAADRLLTNVLYARRGSTETRMRIYKTTFNQFKLRPIFGYGTERDIGRRTMPLGSHSYYLSVLYKHGIVGLICFMGIWWELWRATMPPKRRPEQRGGDETEQQARARLLLRFGRWITVALLLNAITDVLDLDMLLMMVMWAIFGTLIGARALYDRTGHVAVEAGV